MGVFGLIMPGIDNSAHLGGFVGGYLASMWLDPLKPERMDHFVGAAFCLLATALAIIASIVVTSCRYLLRPLNAQTSRRHYRGRRRDRPRPHRSPRRARRPPHRHHRHLPAGRVDREEGGPRDHRIDHRPRAARAADGGIRGGSDLPPRGAALDALGVHAGRGAPGQRRRHAAPARIRAARGRIARPSRRLHLSLVDRGLRPARSRRRRRAPAR